MPYFGKPVDRVIKQGQNTVGSDAIIDDSVIPAKLDSTANYTVGALNVDGTVTADGLTVDGNATINSTSPILTLSESDTTDLNTRFSIFGGGFRLDTISDDGLTAKKRLTIGNATGDISFYEDTGTTAKLFWDASTERLGIGTTAPSYPLSVYVSGANANLGIQSHNSTPGSYNQASLRFSLSSTSSSTLNWDVNAEQTGLTFDYEGSEKMRIESSGRVLVGKTSYGSVSTDGTTIDPSFFQTSASSDRPMLVNRNTTDGNLIEFFKGGTAAGAIGTTGNSLTIGAQEVGLYFYYSGPNSNILPYDIGNNTTYDNAISIGNSSNRFKDLYLSGGVYVGGTGSANHLDDYEEGTFTPDCDVEGAGDMTVSTQSGFYVKVGRMVHVWGRITISGVTGAGSANAWEIKDFPFTSDSNSSYGTASFSWRATGLSQTANDLVGFIGNNANSGRLEVFNGTTTVNASNWAQNGSDVRFNFAYITP